MSLSPLSLGSPPLLDLEVSDERDAIHQVSRLLANNPAVTDLAGFEAAVFDRQRINPPVLGSGVAMPHARTGLVTEIVCVAARCQLAVPFGPEQVPVRLIFLFGIPPHRISQYLAMTAALVKRLRNPEVLAGLLAAANPDEFLRWLD